MKNTMYTATGTFKVNEDNDNFLEYTITTTSGQSGSPILKLNEKGKKEIIGIHIGTTIDQTKNMAVRLTEEKRKIINKWLGIYTS